MSHSTEKFVPSHEIRSAMSNIESGANASMVNRTHRVVRERAKAIKARQSRLKGLWIPMVVCSALLVILCSAVWSVMDQYELAPVGVPDSGDQMMVLLLWFFPVSAALLAMVWFRRTRVQSSDEASR